MTKRGGFSLIESLLALVITAGLLILTTGTGRQLIQPFRHDRLAWYQAIQVLERPGQFQLDKVVGDTLVLTTLTDHHESVRVAVDSKLVLRATNDRDQGYYPLLNRVVAVHWHPLRTKGLVYMQLKQEELPWEETILDLRGSTDSLRSGQ